MPQLSLLDMVQDIMSDLEFDNVNSINDTVEAQQIALIIRTAYYEILTDNDWPHLGTLTTLISSSDSEKPSHMKMAGDNWQIEWINYNKKESVSARDRWEAVHYVEPSEFVKLVNSRNSTLASVRVVTDYSGVPLLIVNNKAPTSWTSFDNSTVVFDSYDSTVDSILQSSKTQVFAYREPEFTISDTFVPDLPSKAFPYLLSEAKSVAFIALKQAPNQKEEQRAQRQRRRLSRDRWSHNRGITYPNYGRTK